MQEFDSYYAAIESAKQLATEKKPEQFLVYANRNRIRFFTGRIATGWETVVAICQSTTTSETVGC
jgi:hypothetical protein